MRTAWIMAVVGFAVMAAALTYGFTVGHFWDDGRVITSVPWGRVSLVDVYVGFALFSGWVVYRERFVWRAAIWVLLFLTLGNLITTLYVLIALRAAAGDWRVFWLGARA